MLGFALRSEPFMIPLHAAAIHIPLALALVLPILSLGVLLAMWRKFLPAAAWSVVFGLQLTLAATGLVAMSTGESEEERVEHVVPHDALEEHEEWGERFARFNLLVAAIGLLPLVAFRARAGLRVAAYAAATLGMGASAGLAYQTGKAGGELVYVHGAAAAYGQPPREADLHGAAGAEDAAGAERLAQPRREEVQCVEAPCP